MPTPWHYHHHASLMRWYVLDHEQFLSFSILFSSHHSGTSWTLSHLSIGCCYRTVQAFLDVVWQTQIWSSCFWGSPMVYVLWWTLCIHSVEVFSWLLTLTHIHLPPGECSWSGQLLWMGLLVLLSSPVHFFLRMFQTVDLATPNVFAISLIGLFWFFSLMMVWLTDSDSSLDLILRVYSNRFQMQIAHFKWTLALLSVPCKWDNEGITHTWPWNSWEANCPITFGPLKSGRYIYELL